MWLDRWIISCWCTCSMKASVLYTSLGFGGFFLPAAHEFLMNAEKNTHGNAKKYKMKRRREERIRRRVQTDTPCAKYFRSWKAERGRRRRSHIIPGNTRHGAMKVFVSLLIDFSRKVLSKARSNCGDRPNLSLRLKDFSRLAVDSEIILISSLIYFYNLRTLKKRVNKAIGEEDEDNFRKHAALHNSEIFSRNSSFISTPRTNGFRLWSAVSFIFGSLVINITSKLYFLLSLGMIGK